MDHDWPEQRPTVSTEMDSRDCGFLDDREQNDDALFPPEPETSTQWVFNESSFQLDDDDDDIEPIYSGAPSDLPVPSDPLPNLEIPDCWEPGMGLADDPIELVPPADVSLAVDDQMPLEMLMSTFDRDEMRQYVQRQEIVKSLHLQAPGGFAAASQSIVVAQISDPKLHSSTSPTVVTPAKPKRKQVRRVKKEQENSTPDTQQRRKQRDGTGKGCSTPQPSSRAAKKLATEANRPSGIPTARHASASTVM